MLYKYFKSQTMAVNMFRQFNVKQAEYTYGFIA